MTFGVSINFVVANFLASRSFGNVSVALASVRFPRGSSNETYHVPRDLLAMRPPRAGYAARLTSVPVIHNTGAWVRIPPLEPKRLLISRGLLASHALVPVDRHLTARA